MNGLSVKDPSARGCSSNGDHSNAGLSNVPHSNGVDNNGGHAAEAFNPALCG